MIEPKERYRFFPKESLDAAFTACNESDMAQVTVNGKTVSNFHMNISGGMNEIKIKYPKYSFSELFIELKVFSRTPAKVVLHHLPGGGSGKCHLKVIMEENSSLTFVELARTKSNLQSICRYEVAGGCTLDVTTLDIDNNMISRDQTFNLSGRGSDVNVRGLFMSAAGEYADNYIKMNHLCPDCSSSQDYRGVCSGNASFLGHIYIAQDSQRSVALQQSRNIIVGEQADIHARPWLEIYADDVKCNHGATVGTSDDQALFYMRQRGIPEEEAKALLLEGFLKPIADAAMFADQRTMINIRSKLAVL